PPIRIEYRSDRLQTVGDRCQRPKDRRPVVGFVIDPTVVVDEAGYLRIIESPTFAHQDQPSRPAQGDVQQGQRQQPEHDPPISAAALEEGDRPPKPPCGIYHFESLPPRVRRWKAGPRLRLRRAGGAFTRQSACLFRTSRRD